jgi:hypothetical protein
MITSAYAMNATKPSMAQDFTTGVLDPRVTVTRALNTATRVNSSGLIESVNAGLPRFDYNSVTLAPKGLLVEEARSNNYTHSNDFSQAVWLKSNATLDAAAITAPDGNMTGWKLKSNVGFVGDLYRDPGLGGQSTFSIFAKEAEWRYIQLIRGSGYSPANFARVDLRTGAITSGSGFSVELYKNGWWRIYDTSTYTSGDRIIYIRATNAPVFPNTNGDGTSGIYIAFAQIENGAFPTSYIPTTTAAVTRNADVATMTGTNFSDWWRPGKGSALVRARPATVSGTRPLVQFDDNTADNIIALRGNATNPELYIRTAGSDQAQIDAGTIAANTSYRLAGAWATNDCAASINSGTSVRDGVATIPVVTQARLGSDGTNYLNGHLEAIEYYEERVPNSSLQVVSSAAGYRSIIGPVFRDTIIS